MWRSGAFCPCLKDERSVWLSAFVLVDVQLFDLLLQEGNGHRAATGSVWQRIRLEHRKHMQGIHNVQGSHSWHVLDLDYPSKVSPFSQGTRGRNSCGGFLSCPFFQVSTLQGLSGWRDLTARSHPRYFSTRRFPCCFLSRYFGGKQMSHPLNLKDGKRNQSSGLLLNQWIRLGAWWRTDVLKLLPLVLDSGAGVHGQELDVFFCFFEHSVPTWSRQCLWQFIPQSEKQTWMKLMNQQTYVWL